MDMNAAYVAGLIDGEGCIHLDATGRTYKARVSVGMSAPALPLLQSLQEEWGGTLYQARKANDRWAAAYTWHLTSESAEALIRAVRPYLRLKVKQADLALEVQEHWRSLPRRANGQAIWSDEARATGLALKERMHVLNAKGPRAPVTSAGAA